MTSKIARIFNSILRPAGVRLTREVLPSQGGSVNGALKKAGLRLTRAMDVIDLADLADMVGRDAKVVLDVGANDGRDSLRLANTFPRAQIHCFEPEPRAVDLFRKNITDKRVTLHEMALGAENGTMTFYRSGGVPEGRESEFPDGWHMSGSIRKPKEAVGVHTWMEFSDEMAVEVRTLDAWAASEGIDRVDFIWADVQGAEVDLIRGGKEILKSTRYLYTEYSNVEQYEGQWGLSSLLNIMPGWEVKKQYPGDALLVNTTTT